MKKYIIYTKEKGKIETDNLYDVGGLTLHREDGPAIQRFHTDGKLYTKAYYINGELYTKSNYDAEVFKMKLALL